MRMTAERAARQGDMRKTLSCAFAPPEQAHWNLYKNFIINDL